MMEVMPTQTLSSENQSVCRCPGSLGGVAFTIASADESAILFPVVHVNPIMYNVSVSSM